ncbi:MAG: cytochrome C oxidase subunit IV family protein [Nitrospirae bacterium]|nr:cytochrome C oxidase subunit IV family protein [Nitrospirota bacterium]
MNDMKTETGPAYSGYVLTWLVLLGLTAATVLVYHLHLGSAGAAAALAIASLKAGLILLFFMHLLREGPFLRAIFLLPVLLTGVIIGLTFLDVWYR